MTDELLIEIRAHAAACAPLESCGLLVIIKGREKYFPCRNLATGADHFQIHPEDYAEAEEAGDIVKVVHSHVYIAPIPSQADLVGCEASGMPWLIVNHPVGHVHEFAPSNYKAPLIGRVFSHGVLDCYTLIRDYYLEELKIEIPNFERADNWWLTNQDLYRSNFAKAGFVQIEEADLRQHDVVLMQLSANKTNHGGVYLGGGIILHHPMNRLSGRDQYGGFWKKITTHYLRHQQCL